MKTLWLHVLRKQMTVEDISKEEQLFLKLIKKNPEHTIEIKDLKWVSLHMN